MIDNAKGKKHRRKRKGGKVLPSNHGHVPVFQRQEYRPFQGTIHVAGMVCRSTETCYSATVFACFFPTSTTLLWPFHGKQQAYPIPLAQTPPTPSRASHLQGTTPHQSVCTNILLYWSYTFFHLQPSSSPFVPRVSSFYILAASAKQLMCTECVDSNCLAIVAPSRSRLLLACSCPCPKRDEALDHRAVCTDPAAILPFDSSLISR